MNGLIDGIGDLAESHFDTERVHRIFEFDTIFAALNSIHLNANDLHLVLFQHTGFGELRTKVQSGLTAKVRQQGVGALFFNDLCQPFAVERLDVGDVCRVGIGHDRRGV